jgi:hypothetical protein
VQVRLFGGSVDGENGVNDIRGELLSQGMVQLGGKGSTSDGKEQLAVDGTLELELVKELGESKS